MNNKSKIKKTLALGAPYVWLTSGAVAFCMILVIGVIGLITVRGAVHFWPKPVVLINMVPGMSEKRIMGEIVGEEVVSATLLKEAGIVVPDNIQTVERILVKIGNRKLNGIDFKWINQVDYLAGMQNPATATVIEREEWGNFYGFIEGVNEDGRRLELGNSIIDEVQNRLERRHEIADKIRSIENSEMRKLNGKVEQLRLSSRRLELKEIPKQSEEFLKIDAQLTIINKKYDELNRQLAELYKEIERDQIDLLTANGAVATLDMKDIVRVYQPNTMSFGDKVIHYIQKVVEFVSEEPREANTEGGIFPAIFGTVIMVLLMSVFVTPFGVVAPVYLNEYAGQNALTRAIRVAVNNLAGVPSVVYGVFGLGFFVYFVGGSIDDLFYPEFAPAPKFGTPGLIWSSLTLAILTVPVVIVSTEEGLRRIPRNLREGSLALGATKAETLIRTVLPMATPAMMTGLILAVARAAGEVAPLMMVGVVKLAPSLPIDGTFPFIHMERKFMHMGFHIYDVGFQSPNVEAARPLVYATSFLLIVIIITLNMTAITARNRLREKYNATDA